MYTNVLHLPSVYWLTDWLTNWLICPHNALRNFAKVQKYTLAKLLKQGFRQALIGGGDNLDHVCLKGNMGIEVHKPSIFLQWSLSEPGETILLDKTED